MATSNVDRSSAGGAVNKFGNEVVDPTRNVLDLVEAAVRRSDDLREAESMRVDQLRIEVEKRLDERINREHINTKEVADLRAAYEDKLRDAEAKRIDAVRVVDVQAVSTANEKATAQASVLATQVTQSADTLRSLVASNAAALATQLTQIITPITDRLSLLEKAQYENSGRGSIKDPQYEELVKKLERASESISTRAGKSAGLSQGWAVLIGVVGLIGSLIGIFLFLNR